MILKSFANLDYINMQNTMVYSMLVKVLGMAILLTRWVTKDRSFNQWIMTHFKEGRQHTIKKRFIQ
jgi:hypothetical protein